MGHRSSQKETKRDNPPHSNDGTQFHTFFCSDESVAQRRCLASALWRYDVTWEACLLGQLGTTTSVNDSLLEKYSRQMLFAGIGPAGQRRLLASRATVVGCGAIGAAAANLLVRAGVGTV